MVKGQVVLEFRRDNALGPLFGQVVFVRGRDRDLISAWRDVDDVVKRQIARRGHDRSFTFKAADATWVYEPIAVEPTNADPTLVQFYDVSNDVKRENPYISEEYKAQLAKETN